MLAFRLCLLLLCLATLASCSGMGLAPQDSFIERQLVQLDELPAPDGVPAADWNKLKAALRTQLEHSAGKTVSAPSLSNAARAPISFDEPTTTLSWYFSSPGDYDQNGEVNVSDLTPLGVHLGETSPTPGQPWPVDTVQAVIDGDSNGEINLADLTPIGANIGRRLASYNVYSAVDVSTQYPAGNADLSTVTPIGNVLLGDAVGQHTTQRLRFNYVVTGHQVQNQYWVRGVDSGIEGTSSHHIPLRFEMMVCDEGAGIPCGIGARASANTGWIQSWEWDMDGDGVFEITENPDLPYGYGSERGRFYNADGEYTISARATDTQGYQYLQTKTFTLDSDPGKWHHFLVNNEPDAFGFDPSLRVVSGNPAIVFERSGAGLDYQDNALLYYRADDALGMQWGSPVPLSEGLNDIDVDFEIVNGVPAVVYSSLVDVPSNTVHYKYRQASDPFGFAWDPLSTVSTEIGVGGIQLADYNGAPRVLYADHVTRLPTVAQPGATLSDPWIPASYGSSPVWGFSQMGFSMVGGELGVSFLADLPTNEVHYIRLTGAPVENVVATLGFSHMFETDLVEAGGLPFVLYANSGTSYGLHVSRGDDADGSGWQIVEHIADQPQIQYANVLDMALIGGNPAIVYNGVDRVVMYTVATDSTGLIWKEPDPVMCPITASQYSLFEVQGHPAIAIAGASDVYSGAMCYAIKY